MDRDSLENLTVRLRPIFQRYGVLRAIVFGSLARDEPSRDSDLDLVVVEETDKRFLDRYDGILKDIILEAQCDVDLLIYTPEELSRMLDRPFIREIISEGIVIYESQRNQVPG